MISSYYKFILLWLNNLETSINEWKLNTAPGSKEINLLLIGININVAFKETKSTQSTKAQNMYITGCLQ